MVRIRLYFFKLHRADRDAPGSAFVLAAQSGSGEVCFFIIYFCISRRQRSDVELHLLQTSLGETSSEHSTSLTLCLGADPPQTRGGLVPAVVVYAVRSPEAGGCVASSLAAGSSTPGDSWLVSRAVRNKQSEDGDSLPQRSAGVQKG